MTAARSPEPSSASLVRKLKVVHADMDACKACPKMIGPVVHGPPVASRILLVGQAPGPEAGRSRHRRWSRAPAPLAPPPSVASSAPAAPHARSHKVALAPVAARSADSGAADAAGADSGVENPY